MTSTEDTGRSYHLQCTGDALETAKAHSNQAEGITLFGSCFCPFVQRVWVTLEHIGFDYTVSRAVLGIAFTDPLKLRSTVCIF